MDQRFGRRHRYDPLAVLQHIAHYQREYGGRSPSQRRIQRDLHISAPSVVHTIVHRLQREGLLVITTYGRGLLADLMLTDAGRTAVQAWTEPGGPDRAGDGPSRSA